MSGVGLVLAWPETKCKQAGAWYDGLMDTLKFSKDGYYKVGHAAIVLINKESGKCHYFDFGRYHAPKGNGRVRDESTDFDLEINTKAVFDSDGNISNVIEVLIELQQNSSCHGDGNIKAGVAKINFDAAYSKAKGMQENVFMKYGPFVFGGTNCSRFVRSVALEGMPFSIEKLMLAVPPMITPAPMWNVKAVTGQLTVEERSKVVIESYEAETA